MRSSSSPSTTTRRSASSSRTTCETDVLESHQRRGIGRSLLEHLAELARERGIDEGFVLTEPDNDAANGLYAGLGGVRSEAVMWDFEYDAG
jgi:GNAT superfamily N-acetyltransferase